MFNRRSLVPVLATLAAALCVSETAAAEERRVTVEEGYVIHPRWLRRPAVEDLQRLYPREQRGVEGFVIADCLIDERGTFSTCEIVEERPAGKGFGESTIRLSKLFKMTLTDADGAPVAGRKLHLPVRWYAGYSR